MANLSITETLRKYISKKIPKSQTNIFFLMFNGIQACFENLEYILNIRKRESNILTANFESSLRSLSAQNGYIPTLKIPSSGVCKMFVSSKLFGRVGYPIFLPPYSTFINKNTNIEYYYNSNKVLKIDSSNYLIPLVEGAVRTLTHVSTGLDIERIYIPSPDVANNSVSIEVGGVNFVEVQSFFDNDGLNDNRQFIVRFSENPQQPIVIYIRGTQANESVVVNYRVTVGEIGNINYLTNFETQDFINNIGNPITVDEKEIVIQNNSGFTLGSNGSTKDSMRAAIGYNHGQTMLFDSTTFSQFIGRYSTLMLQKIKLGETSKSINNIFVMKRQYYNTMVEDTQTQYQKIVDRKSYLLTDVDKANLNGAMEDNVFCLASHNLYDAEICKFAFQVLFEKKEHQELHGKNITNLIYTEFSRFLVDKDYVFNVETYFAGLMEKYKIKFDYTVFNEKDEIEKLKKLSSIDTEYIIKHGDYLPILRGDFNIATTDYKPLKLFFDVNLASEDILK